MTDPEWTEGREAHGFTVTGRTPLPEINATLIQLRHLKTGARMVHLACQDDNNLFAVGFRTTPRDSTGVAHILEHTALCGSQRYPVRDPFFSMIKRSLNTFMNAMTSSDWTFYPFSTQNVTDFDNLLRIYLDAAFFPLLRERDFRQEGHRLEFEDPDDPKSPLMFKGVVYNEMKGAMADPSSLLGRRMAHALYPTTTYGYNSGGEPLEILDLTWQGLKDFHAHFYHPANAWFFTYGDLPLEDHLARIEELALSRFEARQVDTAVPDEVRFDQPRRTETVFPVDAGESLVDRSMVQLGWLTCPVADSFERLALSVLAHLLLGNSAAPLHKALLDSRLGQNLAPGTGYHDDNRETLFAAGLQGTNPEKADEIEKLVLATLENCARDGFARERIEAAIHQIEFGHREVSGDHYPYPLQLLMRILGPWLHSGDPVAPLQLDRNLERLRRELDAGPFFQDLIRRQLLDNPHRVTLTLRPDEKARREEEKSTTARLDAIRARLTAEEEQAIVRQAQELKNAQETPEDLSVLPTLGISDIPPREKEVACERDPAQPIYWLPQPTNGISYFTAFLPADHLPADLRPYVPLFCAVLSQIGAAGHTYEEMADRITAATGGVRAGYAIFDDPHRLDAFRVGVNIRGKALVRNQENLFAILTDIVRAPDFSDYDRLYTLFNQMKVSLENSIPGSGHSYAARAAASELTPAARLREEWGGLHYIRLVREVAGHKADDLAEVAGQLRRLGENLLTQNGPSYAVTAEAPAFADIRSPLQSFCAAVPAGLGQPAVEAVAAATAGGSAEGIGYAASVPVSYVARTFRTVPYTHADSAPLMVLAKLLRAGFLHREIREKGGAYGGMANFDPETGIFSMLSYRDPNLTRTLNVYRQAVDWAVSGDFSEEDIKEAVLAVFGTLDRPLSPGGRGHREFANQLQGMTREMRQEFRHRVLAVNREALTAVAGKYLKEGWPASRAAVVSGEEDLRRANKELGEAKLTIEKI